MVSVGPPAGYGTTIVIGRDGKELARAVTALARTAKARSHNNSHEPAHVIS